ncbi:hypothetical protein ACNSOL_12440 (plasmid) [Aliarcobacter lanthieri]|uniref:hypothetical protein n=1 Tax=Aliarcobacter lanthieri TaxID=1355374 RepID=UPI003AAD3FC5
MTTLKPGTKVIINDETIDCSDAVLFLESLIGKTLEIVEVTNEYKDETLPTYKCKDEDGSIITTDGIEYFPFVDADLKIKTSMRRTLLNKILGHSLDIEFLLQKLDFLEKLTREYDSIEFNERLEHIIDNAEEILVNNLLFGVYKHIGELVINYLLCSDEWFQEYGISNYDVIEKYNIPAPSGINTVYDSILSEFDFENITNEDIEKFKAQIIKDFNLEDKVEYQRLMNISILDFEDQSEELNLYILDCEKYLNKFLEGTKYKVEIYQTDDVYEDYEDHPESEYNTRSMYEGRLLHEDEELELTGRFCEMYVILEDLSAFIDLEIFNPIQEIDDWLEDSCCPKCKGSNYNEEHEFEGSEIFRIWTCSCGAKWTERYNLTKVFYGAQEKEITSESEDNLAYENKQMSDFIQSLGFVPDDITTLIINGDGTQKVKALEKVKESYSLYAIDNKGSTENVE